MAINTSWTGVKRGFPRIDIALNAQTQGGDPLEIVYYPVQIIVAGMLSSADRGEKRHSYEIYVGASKSTPYTKNEIYTLLGHASVPGLLQGAVKEWYVTGIGEDPSA